MNRSELQAKQNVLIWNHVSVTICFLILALMMGCVGARRVVDVAEQGMVSDRRFRSDRARCQTVSEIRALPRITFGRCMEMKGYRVQKRVIVRGEDGVWRWEK